MKRVFSVAVAAAAASLLAGCASTSGQALAPAPSQMTSNELQAELAANRAQISALYTSLSRLPGETAQTSAPVIIYYADPNGGVFTNFTPPDYYDRRYRSGSSPSRPYNYVQIHALSERSARLYAELRSRARAQEQEQEQEQEARQPPPA